MRVRRKILEKEQFHIAAGFQFSGDSWSLDYGISEVPEKLASAEQGIIQAGK